LLEKSDFENTNLNAAFENLETILIKKNKNDFLSDTIKKLSVERKAAAKREKQAK
jgi:hypothetical protein